MEKELQDLIRRAQRYDREALSEIYRAHVQAIYRYIYVRVGRPDVAEDLTSEVFLKALESIRTFDYRGIPVAAWLFRIAHDRVVDYFRKAGREVPIAIGEGPSEDSSSDHPAGLTLRWAMERLTSEQQQVLILRFGEGRTSREIAKILGKTEGAVKALQHRALATLRRLLEKSE